MRKQRRDINDAFHGERWGLFFCFSFFSFFSFWLFLVPVQVPEAGADRSAYHGPREDDCAFEICAEGLRDSFWFNPGKEVGVSDSGCVDEDVYGFLNMGLAFTVGRVLTVVDLDGPFWFLFLL